MTTADPMTHPEARVMQMMTAAWLSQTISAVTTLGVPDIVREHGALSARELTERHGVDARPDFLERALRACASADIFTEAPDGRFGPTPLCEVLTTTAPGSVRDFVELVGGRWWALFGALPQVLRTGQPQTPPRPRGGSKTADREEQFGRAMKSRVDSTRRAVEHGDFGRARRIVDVGGGFGHLAIAILQAHPRAVAMVLDLPDVIAIAERHAASEDPAVLARLSFVAGDMFVDVPPGDTYVLKSIIHDWDDERCVGVLGNCAAKLPVGGRVLCIDRVLPPMGDTGAAGAKLLDLLMMVSLPGRERTEGGVARAVRTCRAPAHGDRSSRSPLGREPRRGNQDVTAVFVHGVPDTAGVRPAALSGPDRRAAAAILLTLWQEPGR
jgi:hypothetical protein